MRHGWLNLRSGWTFNRSRDMKLDAHADGAITELERMINEAVLEGKTVVAAKCGEGVHMAMGLALMGTVEPDVRINRIRACILRGGMLHLYPSKAMSPYEVKAIFGTEE